MRYVLKRAALAALDLLYGLADGMAGWLDAHVLHEGGPIERAEAAMRHVFGTRQATLSHARSHIHFSSTFAERAADAITGFVGSWLFVGMHASWFLVWILFRIEPFPFGLLTLLVSLEAIFLSTFVMMSQNRSAVKDHLRDDLEAQEVADTLKINQQQLTILEQQNTILELLRDAPNVREDVAALDAKVTALYQQISAKSEVRAAKKATQTADGAA